MESYDKERIESLRSTALNPLITYKEMYLYFFRRYTQNSGLLYFAKRYSDAYEYAFANITPIIDDNELIVGKSTHVFTPEEQQEWDLLEKFTISSIVTPCGQDSHLAVDYDLLLEHGISGVIDIIRVKKAALDLLDIKDIEKNLFYESCEQCLKAVVILSNRYAVKAQELSESCDDNKRRDELLQIARICRKVPNYPADNFYEAIQSVHFLSLCLSANPMRSFSMLQYQLGRPDRYLLKYYNNDIANGTITPFEAQTLFDCLSIQINHRVPSGLSSGYMVGGRDTNGKVVSNAITQIAMTTIEHCRLVYPAVGLCCCDDTPESDILLACDILRQGFSHPAIFNDEIISKGLREYGLSQAESCQYIHSTCVEITPIASSNVWVASPYTNLLQILLDQLNVEHTSLESIIDAFFEQLSEIIRQNYASQVYCRVARAKGTVEPLLSCFTNDCLKNGVDIENGGARYNWIMPSFVGMANVIDSFYAIKKVVFDNKQYTIAQIKEMLDANFEGYETQRLQLINFVDKYGNDNNEVDIYAKLIGDWINNECKKYTYGFPGGKLIPSLFCWIMHDILGSQTGASPEGRQAFFPLSDGSGPAQGRERNGPTASILSSTKFDHSNYIGGIAVNMKFSKKLFDNGSKQKLSSLIKTYLDRGGFELQINVTDKETLKKAQLQPEQYQDLVVRIGGYSDYFVKLSPSMQAEVLLRTEHEI